jgi:signal transduction histidine kinase
MIGKLKDWLSLIADIEESTDMANVVLNDLVNYDKISMGNLVTEFKLHSLWELVATAVNPFKVQARRKGVSLVVDLELHQEGPHLHPAQREVMQRLVGLCDNMKIAQVVRNLVSNAIKFTPSGGTVTVKVEWDVTGLANAMPPVQRGVEVAAISPRNNKQNFLDASDQVSSGEACDDHDTLLFGDKTTWQLKQSQVSTIIRQNFAPRSEPSSLLISRAGSVVITVSDTGAGMSQEDQKSLFGEGIQFRVNQLQAGQGSGLGLWISKGE